MKEISLTKGRSTLSLYVFISAARSNSLWKSKCTEWIISQVSLVESDFVYEREIVFFHSTRSLAYEETGMQWVVEHKVCLCVRQRRANRWNDIGLVKKVKIEYFCACLSLSDVWNKKNTTWVLVLFLWERRQRMYTYMQLWKFAMSRVWCNGTLNVVGENMHCQIIACAINSPPIISMEETYV